MSSNMMIGYDIYDCFTMEHFRLRQRMTLTTKIYCSRLYISLALFSAFFFFFITLLPFTFIKFQSLLSLLFFKYLLFLSHIFPKSPINSFFYYTFLSLVFDINDYSTHH
jgi:hypothetical protein